MTNQKLKNEYLKKGFNLYYSRGKGWAITRLEISCSRLFISRGLAEDIDECLDLYKTNLKEQSWREFEEAEASGLGDKIKEALVLTRNVSDARQMIKEPAEWGGSFGFWMVASIAIINNIEVSETDVSIMTSIYHEKETIQV